MSRGLSQSSVACILLNKPQLRQAGEVEEKSIGAQSLGPLLHSSPLTDFFYLQHMQSTHQKQHIHLHHAQENKKMRMVLKTPNKGKKSKKMQQPILLEQF